MSIVELEYPETDGQPMDESDLHQWWIQRLRDVLRERYQGQQVYISGNLLIYPEEGNTLRRVAPDCFVVLDCEPGFRRTFKVWEEGKAPDVVFEVTSNSTKRQDEFDKPHQYGQMGVKEYFLFDPTSDYIDPPLQGFRFVDERPHPIKRNANGEIESQCLGVALHCEGAKLVMTDTATGERLLTDVEQEQAKRKEAEAKRKQEQAKRKQEESKRKEIEDRLRASEAEVAKLREQLQRKSKDK